jgi:hypothetical protein
MDIDQLILDVETKLLTRINAETNDEVMSNLIKMFDDFEHAVMIRRDTNA